jgi:hypothetical protein
MEKQVFNFNSSRAKKARFSVLLDKSWLRGFFTSCSIALFFLWLFSILALDTSTVHLLLIPSAWFLITVLWYHGELKELPVSGAKQQN